MIVDADGDAAAPLAERLYDVCICGAGPAGITLACRLAAHGLEVALLEGGGFEPSDESTDIHRGDVTNPDYLPLHLGRLRYFGGASNHWHGNAPALGPIDFAARPELGLDGWPIGKEALDPYAAEAYDILECRIEDQDHDPFRFHGLDGLRAVAIPRSTPVRFGPKYRQEIEASPRLVLWLHANVVDLVLDADRRFVRGAEVVSLRRKTRSTLRARFYVLCLGGIENPRLLLHCRNQVDVGLGNQHDLVGRFFMDHPIVQLGGVLYNRASAPTFDGERNYAPSDARLRAANVLNYCFRLFNPPVASSGNASALCSWGFLHALADAIGAAPADCPPNPDGLVRVQALIEQAPDAANRVTLSDRRDALGLPRVHLRWGLNDLDRRTMRAAVLQIGARFASGDLGRVRMAPWLDVDPPQDPPPAKGLFAGTHHLGTTRMGDHPRQGVVDRDCRVFGLENLYIGGSSVFPRAGWSNPTFTIVQLALRLGDHLAARLRG
jgi:choline dehydrogenase-like flavoprotein